MKKDKDKSTSKIDFELILLYRTLVFHINKMDERFRAYRTPITFISSNGITITSDGCPDISLKNIVYLRGKRKVDDDRVSMISFPTHLEAEKYKEKVIKALDEWSKSWPGFYTKEDKPKNNGCRYII